MVNVLIVDDHPVRRNAVARLVDASVSGVSVKETALDQAPPAGALDGDTTFLVVGSEHDGMGKRIAALRDMCGPVAILALGDGAHADTAVEALRAGARGFVLSDAEPGEIARALDSVARGEFFIGSIRPKHHADGTACCGGHRQQPRAAGHLTPRETEVLELAGAGLTMRDIARRMAISRRTVERHLYNACGKLNAHGRAEAVRAYRMLRGGAA